MIGYVTVGTNNIKAASDFYDTLFQITGGKKVYDFDRFVGWVVGESEQMFAVVIPFDKQVATFGNGTMVAFKVANEAVVKDAHAKALALGGVCEGEPGIRQGNYYCGYCRDLDGNKLNFYTVLDGES
jgi:catechol 2,3-dioxygenase-like lactoylglutathione lyase family enzyme